MHKTMLWVEYQLFIELKESWGQEAYPTSTTGSFGYSVIICYDQITHADFWSSTTPLYSKQFTHYKVTEMTITTPLTFALYTLEHKNLDCIWLPVVTTIFLRLTMPTVLYTKNML